MDRGSLDFGNLYHGLTKALTVMLFLVRNIGLEDLFFGVLRFRA